VKGEVIIGRDHLLLKNVPIVAPAGGSAGAERGGEELIKSLNLRVEKGEHTLITGPKWVISSQRVRADLCHGLVG
jgi:ATP-binding cassette subfamily D (ALD) long-chain fatty acid import protein